MSDINESPAQPSMSLDASSDIPITDYAIDAADRELADQIVNFDPVYDTPGSVTFTGDVRLPDEVPLSTLPPHLADPIKARLQQASAGNRPALERQLVREALYNNSLSTRVQNGAGPLGLGGSGIGGASLYQQEFLAVAREQRMLDGEYLDISTQLAAIDHVRHDVDPATGQPVQTVVNEVEGEKRKHLEYRLREIDRNSQALAGFEGQRRLAKALKASVEAHKKVLAEKADHDEVNRRAAEMERELRIQARAEKKARILGASR